MDDMQNREEICVGMTDYQFKYVMELRDKYEALRCESGKENGDGMTDLQFTACKEERDKREAELLHEIAALREENSKLKMRTPD